ncbi:hypothetical protein F5883DRAFT_578359 [Diaporthe sp. PMI_573]|nr:hypothetical protein F5883DRAFT_578359 [Diaporthaceae sp. PMI_573]
MQRQCQTCLATFNTNDELQSHLEVYRSGDRVLSAQAEKCRAHAIPHSDLLKLCGVDDGIHDGIDDGSKK